METDNKLPLLNDSSESESSKEESDFKINRNYADSYNVWRNKEELQKLKDLSKDVSSSSSSTETEGEYNSEDELDFFRTLSLLKAKDPRIYDKNTVFYKNKTVEKKPKVKKPKPLYMKDYERNIVLERNGQFSSDEEEFIPSKGPTYSEEQENLKRSFKEALGDSDEEDDNLLEVHKKSKDEKEKEEADYVRWLKGEEIDLPDDTKKDLLHLRKFFNDPNLDENEKFLRDFFLNRKWAENASGDEIPSYDVVSLSEDEKITEEQDKFERAYNFRFEEPDEEFIKRYPRVIEDSLRKSDTRRKIKREEYTERKKKEKEQKREELKRLKALKRKEIEEKFELLKEVSGQDDLKLNEDDIESDFDPDKHEQRMREMFNNDFYSVEEVQKPEFPYDEEIDAENWDSWAGEAFVENDNEQSNEFSHNFPTNIKKENCEDGIEAYDSKLQFEKEMVEATQVKKKRLKKKSLFANTVSKPKPVFDPSGKSFDDYLDEYYKLDYEDIIGDMPVRFKYRKVVPNDFGLTVDEILAANDKDLNRWCSIKKTCQYREKDEEYYDVQAFQKKAENIVLKKKVLPSVYVDDEEKQSQGTKRKRKKSKKKSNGMANLESILNTGKHETNEERGIELMSENSKEEPFKIDAGEQLSKSQKRKRKRKKLKLGSSERVASSYKTGVEITLDKGSERMPSSSRKDNSENEVEKKLNINELNLKANSECSQGTVSSKSKQAQFSKQQSSVYEKHINGFECSASSDISKPNVNALHMQANDSNIDSTQINKGEESVIPGKGKRKKKKSKKNADREVDANLSSHSNFSNALNTNDKVLFKKDKYGQLNNAGNLNANNKAGYRNKNFCREGFLGKKPSKGHEKNYNKHITDKRLNISDDRLAAYGINPKKFKNKIMYSNK